MSYERKTEEMIEITFFRKELNQKLLFYIKIKPSQRNLVCLIYFSTGTFSVSFVRKINLSRAGNCALAFDLKIFDNETQTFLSLAALLEIFSFSVPLFLAHQRYPGNANNVTFSLPFTVRSSSKLSNITKRTNINNLETAGNSESGRLRTHWITWLVT